MHFALCILHFAFCFLCALIPDEPVRLLTRLDAPLQLPRPVLTVGTFDGLHLGHRAILETVFLEARRLGGSAVVLTFDRHPQAVITGNAPPTLLSLEEKRQILEATGLDVLVELPFTPELAVTVPEAFVEDRKSVV